MDYQQWYVEHQNQLQSIAMLFGDQPEAMHDWIKGLPEDFWPFLLDQSDLVGALQAMFPLKSEVMIWNHSDHELPSAAYGYLLDRYWKDDQDIISRYLSDESFQPLSHFLSWYEQQSPSFYEAIRASVNCWRHSFASLHGEDLLRVEVEKFQAQQNKYLAMDQLREAVRLGRVRETQQLIADHALSIHEQDFEGSNMLMIAVLSGDMAIVETILGHCPRLSQENYQGDTALMLAIMQKQVEIAKLLLELGCDVYHKNHDGDNALTLAIRTQNRDLVALLLAHGMKLEQSSYSELQLAEEFSERSIIDLLLEAYLKQSVNLDLSSHYEPTTFRLLVQYQEELVEILHSHEFANALTSEVKDQLFQCLLHPYHAMGAVMYEGYDQDNPPQVYQWLEERLLYQAKAA